MPDDLRLPGSVAAEPSVPVPHPRGGTTIRRRRMVAAVQRPSPPERTHPGLAPDWIQVALAGVPLAVASLLLVMGEARREPMIFLALTCAIFTGLGFWRCHARLGQANEIGQYVMYLGMLFWFYVPSLGAAFSADQWHMQAALIGITNREALLGFLAVTLFFFLYMAVYQFRPPPALQRLAERLLGAGGHVPTKFFIAALVLWLLICIGFFVVQAGGLTSAVNFVLASRAEQKPWSPEGNYGTAVTPIYYVFFSSMIVIAVLAMRAAMTEKVSLPWRALLVLIAAVSTAWTAIEGGTRSSFLQAAIPPFLLFYRDTLDQRGARGLARLGLLAAMVVAIVAFAAFQRYYRYTKDTAGSVAFRVDDNDFLTETAFAIAVTEKEGRYIRDSVTVELVAGPVPRVLWPSKPEPLAIVVYSRYVRGSDITVEGGNVLPSMVGQVYMNWAWLGIAELAFVLAFVMRLCDVAFAVRREWFVGIAYSAFVVWVFITFRALTFGYFFTMYLHFLFAWGVWATSRRLRGRRAFA